MFEKLADSWELVKSSARVIHKDKELLLLPVLSFLATLVVLASFLLPMLHLYEGFSPESRGLVFWVFGFLFYMAQYFVIFFFNSALVSAALERLDGGDPTLKSALSHAFTMVVPLMGYAAIAATVGIILRFIQERSGLLGRLAAGLVGMGWTVATFLVVPVLVSRQVGPVEAIEESVRLLKKTWGQNIAGHVGIGIVFGAASIAVMLLLIPFTLMVSSSVAATLTIFGIGLVIIMGLGVYQSALTGVYQAALYRFAQSGKAPEGFDEGQISSAFFDK